MKSRPLIQLVPKGPHCVFPFQNQDCSYRWCGSVLWFCWFWEFISHLPLALGTIFFRRYYLGWMYSQIWKWCSFGLGRVDNCDGWMYSSASAFVSVIQFRHPYRCCDNQSRMRCYKGHSTHWAHTDSGLIRVHIVRRFDYLLLAVTEMLSEPFQVNKRFINPIFCWKSGSVERIVWFPVDDAFTPGEYFITCMYLSSILTTWSPRAFARVPIPTRVSDRDTRQRHAYFNIFGNLVCSLFEIQHQWLLKKFFDVFTFRFICMHLSGV